MPLVRTANLAMKKKTKLQIPLCGKTLRRSSSTLVHLP
jgi:hypothetical protein